MKLHGCRAYTRRDRANKLKQAGLAVGGAGAFEWEYELELECLVGGSCALEMCAKSRVAQKAP